MGNRNFRSILLVCVLTMALLACDPNPVVQTTPVPVTVTAESSSLQATLPPSPTAHAEPLPTTPTTPSPTPGGSSVELLFSGPEVVMALAAGVDGNVYAVTIEGNLLKIASDGQSEKLYAGLERCGFSDRTVAVLPGGDVVVNDCVDNKDTLLRIDAAGRDTTLMQFEDSLTAMTSDATGHLFLGFWTSEGDVSVNFQPFTYLGGADDIGGRVAVLSADGQVATLYEGGIPLSLAVSGDGALYAAIWGQQGAFRPESKNYTMCGPTKNFWIGFSEQAQIRRIEPEQDPAPPEEAWGGPFSYISPGLEGMLFAFGSAAGNPCGIYRVAPQGVVGRLPIEQDEALKRLTALATSAEYLYFADTEGAVYRSPLAVLSAAQVAEIPAEVSPTPPTTVVVETVAAPGPTAVPSPTASPSPSPSLSLDVRQVAFYEGMANDLAWSPDGQSLAIASSTLDLYDTSAREKVQEIQSNPVQKIAFSPDGTMLASAAYEGVTLWDVDGWGVLNTLVGSKDTGSLAFSPDGKLLATGTGSTVKLWDVATGDDLRTLPGSSGRAVAFSPDGRLVAASGGDAGRDVKLWAVDTGDELPALTGHANWVNSLAFSPDGQLLVSGAVDGTVRLWDVAQGRQARVLRGHTKQIDDVAFSPDGRLVASVSWDLTVKLWDAASGAEVASLTGHTSWIRSVAFSPDGTLLASGCNDQVRLWRIEAGDETSEAKPVYTPSASVAPVIPLSERAISPDNADQVTDSALVGTLDWVHQVAFSPDVRWLVLSSYHVHIHDAETLQQVHVIESVQWPRSIAFSPDGATLAVAHQGVGLWEVGGWGEILTLPGSKGTESLAFSPDGRLLAAGTGSAVKLWEIASGAELHTLPASGPVTTVAFSPDGRTLATNGGTASREVKLWDVVNGVELRTFEGHTSWINSVAFSPDGQVVASGSLDHTIRLWEAATGRQLRTLSGHAGEVENVAFSPDGQLLASAGGDLTVKLWDVATGEELASLSGHNERVTSLAFSADGATLASSANDYLVHLWGIEP